ncbi:MAG: AAA family ATPase [Bernardetiaceae bacterium]|nr:AAA family ATPase [Bernardetiaceae bacterium]
MKTITFFNNKDGIGTTALLHHTAYMFAELGYRVLAVDLDPQTNLSQIFLQEDRLFDIVENNQTIKNALSLIEKKQGDIIEAHVEKIRENLFLIPGDLDLSLIEDKLSKEWYECLTGEWYPFALQSAFYRIIQNAAKKYEIDYIFIDVGPNFGAINRASLISSDYLIVATTADLFSLKGLSNIGERIESWFEEWKKRLQERKEDAKQLNLPSDKILPLGYVLMQHGVTSNKPVKSYKKFADRIPEVFRTSFKKETASTSIRFDADPYCLALIKHYNSLMPMAMEVRKPIFLLKPADGAIGAHYHAVRKVYGDFEKFSHVIIKTIDSLQKK